MSRYSSRGRDALSPFASQDSNGIPRVTEDDFSYITSEDLEHSLRPPARVYQHRHGGTASPEPEDDVLLIKHKGITYPVHFPAFSIGDGKLYVRDVRERVGLVMEIAQNRRRRIKMLYKGRQLKDSEVPIRDYGVKNNSELLVILPDGSFDDESDSESSEEVVVTDPAAVEPPRKSKSKKKGKNKKRKVRSPRDSAQNLDVPGSGAEGGRSSNDESKHPSRIPSPAVPGGALEKLASISSHFNTQLLPQCLAFSANPPADNKKCEDEHRKLSETIMQQVLLKLDEVDTGGDPHIRAKRKELVNQVHEVLRGIDSHLPEGVTRPSW
ncbi:BAG domain-containing protein [Xylariales sp. PMI_506]|nr:BAG domain-containing protein [Xylariales sp. PMI_506]